MRLLVLVLALSSIFAGCKKGEDDPGISLRSRKNRLAGDWHMSGGTASFTEPNYSELFALDGTEFKNYRTYTGGTPTVYYGKYNLSMNFSKDGTLTFSEVSPWGVLKGEGEWNFNNGVGDEKNKESFSIRITNFSKGNNYSGFFNHGSTVMHYRLKELKNKEMVIYSAGMYITDENYPVDYQLTYTLKQR